MQTAVLTLMKDAQVQGVAQSGRDREPGVDDLAEG